MRSGSSDISGELVLESAPYCDFYVVKTAQAYIYLVISPAEIAAMSGSSKVRGSLLVPGRQTVRLDDRIDVSAEVVGSAASWEAAKLRFAAECRTPDLPTEFLKSSP